MHPQRDGSADRLNLQPLHVDTDDAMEDGDILDSFDNDDALAKSIEKGQSGPWNDSSAAFEDPKLAQLQKQLMEPTTKLTYEQRRMRELQSRTARALGLLIPQALCLFGPIHLQPKADILEAEIRQNGGLGAKLPLGSCALFRVGGMGGALLNYEK